MSRGVNHPQSTTTVHKNLEKTTDLSQLPTISDDLILSCLRERFLADNIYTAIGSHTVISVNPYKFVGSTADSTLASYAIEYRDTAEEKTYRPPHIFQHANNAYYHMRRTGQDQSIVITGESGSGKSECRRLAIKSITELSVSNPGKKGSKLATQIPAAEFVLESFGNARTQHNPNASRFGKYTELQFTDRGRLSGMKTLDYYLERARVTSVPAGERNFHIFYYLLAGASAEERQHLHLYDKQPFRYLGQRSLQTDSVEDTRKFEQLRLALKNAGFSKRSVAQTCQMVAAILHLGNLEFVMDKSRNEDSAVVKNQEVLNIVADFLGVQTSALQNILSFKMKMVEKEMCTIYFDPEAASENRDELARTLYSLLFAWINENINQHLCRDDFSCFISMVDFPGMQNIPSSATRSNSLDQFCVNYANERLHYWMGNQLFESHVREYQDEGIADYVPEVPWYNNLACVEVIDKPGGLISIMDSQSSKLPKKNEHTLVQQFGKKWNNHNSFKAGSADRSGFPTFTVQHFTGPVTYSAEGLLERNSDTMNPDFVSLLRGNSPDLPTRQMAGMSENAGSANPFVRSLFTGKAIATRQHPRFEETIVAAQQPVKPMRQPSTRRKGTIRRRGTQKEATNADDDDDDTTPSSVGCIAGGFREALDTLFQTLDETHPWYVICINPNDGQLPNQLEGRGVKAQIRSLGLSALAKRSATVFEVSMLPSEFCERYADQLAMVGISEGSESEKIAQARTALDLGANDIVEGSHKVYLTHKAFHRFEDHIRATDTEELKRNRMRTMEAEAGLGEPDPFAPYAMSQENVAPLSATYSDPFGQSSQQLPLVANAAPFQKAGLYEDFDERKSFRSEDYDGASRYTSNRDDTGSQFGSESYAPSRNMFYNTDKKALLEKDALPGEIMEGETAEEMKETSGRRRWLVLVWILTWWLPNPFLKWFGRMKRMDVRQAWREKLTINIIIWFICACAVFVIAVLGRLICPREYVFSTGELQSHGPDEKVVYTAIRGEVFDLSNLVGRHAREVSVVPQKNVLKYGGLDATDIFPVQVSALCDGINGIVSPYIVLDTKNTTDPNRQYHDFRVITTDPRPDWYFEQMVVMRYFYRVGFMGITPGELKDMAASGRNVAIYKGLVYDLTDYKRDGPGVRAPPGQSPPNLSQDEIHFMAPEVVELFTSFAGRDITKQLDELNINRDTLARQKVCLRNLFTIGKQDDRNSPQCLFATYILLVLSILTVSIIGFKFLAALSFSSPRAPEDHDKFVICQVPCYTEGEESLRQTIDSLAKMKYDDKRKLIFIICDGMIVGSGNDRPTPRIVLDILGHDPNNDPEPLSFLSLGEGSKQHNMGKVYSGLYECSGHVVPYLVVAKVGKPTERQRPGNRGKRDSQMVLMHFLNKVHFNSPMNPLELEIYHQIKNVIGVNPSFYEYVFMIDADTTVDHLSVNRLISAMIHDKKVLGVCGETSLANAKQSIITTMQVYEYYISHHLAKAFESLFGSVTCLPGCFTLYRLRTPDTHKPLFISQAIIDDYSENRVDTLHMKNLLHLGEDRYLTTLLLKHFPNYKTHFVRDAHAYTHAPDEWSILLSQRRRWINSTIHNLGELVFLDRLCGFCCFSMRFVVFVDLLSTIVQPITVAYIVYLIYLVSTSQQALPVYSLAMLAAIYALQALIFIVRRKWDMVGWMVFYILAIPAFSFLLPLYSFWRMDDFSWGQTRVVLGEKGKKLIVHDEGKFDPRSIPLKSWSDYENELWDKESNHSIGSWVPQKMDGGYDMKAESLYGRETYYEAPGSRSRSYSPLPAPPGYQSGRNSPSLSAAQSRPGSMAMMMQQPSRPVTNYLDMPFNRSSSPFLDNNGGGMGAPGQPSNAELEQAVNNLLRGADLSTVTKRDLRRQVEEAFGCDLTSRKTDLNAMIDRALMANS